MPRKENKRPLQRGTRPHGQAVCEDYITSPSSSNFLPFSRIHRADLNVLLDSKSADLSTEFCHLWATSRNVDPAFVIDWVRRRCAGGFRRTRGISNTRDHIPVASLQTDTHDISVKRERAASPVLSTLEPAKKKVKARHLQETRIQECSSLNKVTGPSKELARHTRAHDKNPHPACSTCLQSSGFALRGISGSVPKTVPEADLQLATPWTVRSILKSALRTSCPSESVTRAPRHVRFSQELCLEAFTAYSQHVAEPGEYHANYRLNGEVSSLVTHSGDSSASLLPSTLSSPALSGLPGDSSDFKPPWRTVTSSRSVSRMSFLAPRTPSPPQSSKPRDCSLFSPSFFSPTGSSSGDDEVEALLASSPPTSPLPFAADRTTFSAVSPLPTRSLPTSVVHDLVGRYASEESVVDVAPFATESHGSLPLLSPADIPPRVRTPPSSGPGPGSKPCTPQPHRPTRPTSETLPATRWPPAATEKEYRHTNGLPFPLRARAPQCTQDSARLFRVTERFRPGSGNEGTDVDLEAAHMHVRQESTVANPELSLPESLVRSTLSTQQPPRPARSRSTPDIQANTDETAHDGQDGEAEQMVVSSSRPNHAATARLPSAHAT
ncbi:hypothetical protein BC628DRAFT_425059 [Trametes gibbosa]|nr:hypothetical protein BC628DRAFT_425059 [Trametes gibbosa]